MRFIALFVAAMVMNQGHQQQQNGQHCQVVDDHILVPKGGRCA